MLCCSLGDLPLSQSNAPCGSIVSAIGHTQGVRNFQCGVSSAGRNIYPVPRLCCPPGAPPPSPKYHGCPLTLVIDWPPGAVASCDLPMIAWRELLQRVRRRGTFTE